LTARCSSLSTSKDLELASPGEQQFRIEGYSRRTVGLSSLLQRIPSFSRKACESSQCRTNTLRILHKPLQSTADSSVMGAAPELSSSAAASKSALQVAFETQTSANSPHPAHLQHLAIQVRHNLQYQHGWTDLHIHDYSPLPFPDDARAPSAIDGTEIVSTSRKWKRPLPRPMISGLPPQRLYMHPDEQAALLQTSRQPSKSRNPNHNSTTDSNTASTAPRNPPAPDNTTTPQTTASLARLAATSGMSNLASIISSVQSEREWVLPSHLREKWSLRRFGEVFDEIEIIPPAFGATDMEADVEEDENTRKRTRDVPLPPTKGSHAKNPWRTKKRVLLATVDDDSTIVYYIVHDGIVKPRQN